MKDVYVSGIALDRDKEFPVVLIRSDEGDEVLPIWIGPFEAEAIAIRLRDIEVARPLTHDLLGNVIAEMGGEVSHIAVTDLRNDTFYARITVNVNGHLLEIDSRPSDAIALAVRVDAPIFVEDTVMEHSITPEMDISEDEEGEDMAAFQEFVNNLDLDDLPIQ